MSARTPIPTSFPPPPTMSPRSSSTPPRAYDTIASRRQLMHLSSSMIDIIDDEYIDLPIDIEAGG